MNIIKRNNSQINVCIISKWFYPTLIGPGERFRRYASGLRQRGINISVITMQLAGQSELEEIDGISIQRVQVDSNEKFQTTALLKQALKIIHKKKDKPDVIQLLNHSIYSFFYIILARLLGLPFIFIYTMTKPNKRQIKGSLLYRLKKHIYFRLKYHSLNCVVTSSSVMSKSLSLFGVSNRNLKNIPNGVDTERFNAPNTIDERNALRKELGFSKKDEIILFVGMISYRKGIDTLISAWDKISEKNKNAKLVLVGHRTDKTNKQIPNAFRDQAYMDSIDDLIHNSYAPDRVIFMGNKNNVEIYMKVSDLFVFPSRVEGMPNVVPEAMASGLSCLLMPFIGLPEEFGRPGREYILVKRNSNELASKVIEILRNDNLRKAIRENAMKWVNKYLGVNKSLDKYEKLYRETAI